MFQIESEELVLKIASLGAEMKSLVDKQTGQEYLWHADPAYWGRTSPILFPFVGGCKNNEMSYEGETYSVPKHGFARNMEFDLISRSEHEIWFAFTSNEETLKEYPFHFCLSIGYRMEGKKIHVMWKVENTDKKKMYFSIGGHPAFNCPIHADENQTDYKIAFDVENNLQNSLIAADGLLAEDQIELELQDGKLAITEHLFDNDALVIENEQVHKVGFVTPSGKEYVSVEFDAPVVGIWSPAGKCAPFICIEPWYGRCDRSNFTGTLEEREYGNELNPGELFEKSYTITVV